ncbi:flagellar motor protein MotB [Parvularcula dongshanensis]|uniref:Chemotaxis protein MotB n=1 Tax=Parvularcula dongshanensis TaxID=1173995 RepID=A0A840I605_9PROT|nr:flagellar motor protein MotB [Parvularcula dongshanensis]MBB4659614.1 chemotaxis protein MotB [Parvularcula dongshanensis]
MSSEATIIKRKRVVVAGGHHGGAWKVAYADFVTAMMAFFLLMWLLNATTEDQRKGLADYFDPSIPISPISGGGTDMLEGDSIATSENLPTRGGDEEAIQRHPAEIEAAIVEAAAAQGLADADGRVRVTETEEGIVIELLEAQRHALFAKGSAAPSSELRALLSGVAGVIDGAKAPVKITGHTDGYTYDDQDYTNWELSADRANTARRLLLAEGVDETSFDEVSGRADRAPLAEDRHDPANRRIAITLLGKKADAMPTPSQPMRAGLR